MSKTILPLSAREDLKIFMSPVRQQIIRTLSLHGHAMTAKALSDVLGISASSATHHIRLLEKIGILSLDHTETINGIVARFYALCDVTVSIGMQCRDDLDNERSAVMQNILQTTFAGFDRQVRQEADMGIQKEALTNYGDFLNGVLHLTQDEAEGLLMMIRDYLDAHEKKRENTKPWEYALILYRAEDVK